MGPRQRSGKGARLVAGRAAPMLAIALGTSLVGGPATALVDPVPSATLTAMRGRCGASSLRLAGELVLDVPEGSAVTNTYVVESVGQRLDLGSSAIDATATVATTTPFADDVFFGPRWTSAYPFTYTMATEVVVGGSVVAAQVMTAECTADGAEATVTVVPVPISVPGPDPQPDRAVPAAVVVIEPRFTG